MNWRRFVFFIAILLFSCNPLTKEDDTSVDHHFYCDLETVSEKTTGKLSTDNPKFPMPGSNGRSDEMARSGKYSVKSNPDNPFVLTIKWNDFVLNNFYELSIWKSPGAKGGYLVIEGSTDFRIYQEAVEETDSLGWQKMTIRFLSHPEIIGENLKMYFWNKTDQDIYLDDYSLVKLDEEIVAYGNNPLRLYVNKKDMDNLHRAREKALEDKILITTDESYAKAILFHQDFQSKVKIRFKGDWLDHLKGYKWSFRIAIKKGEAWRGMRTFNIQNPHTRSYLLEWLAHRIAEKEDILTTRYEFIPVYLNQMNLGLFAYEEHFEKQLVESKNRREGPILKFSEDQMWLGIKNSNMNSFSPFESSKIMPFKQGKTTNSPSLFSQFNRGKELLNAFKRKEGKVSDVFDVDKMAKYLAFIDFTRGYHGARWHNIRFYYNPVISKLEPIAYDLFADNKPMDAIPNSLLGNADINLIEKDLNEVECSYFLFRDSVFTTKYIEYVTYFSDPKYLDNIYQEFGDELNALENQLQIEFTDYSFDRNYLAVNQKGMQRELPELKKKAYNELNELAISSSIEEQNLKPSNYQDELVSEIVQVYKEDEGYTFLNYSLANAEIVGYHKKDKVKTAISDGHVVKSYREGPGRLHLDVSEKDITAFEIKLIDHENNCWTEVIPWSAPSKIVELDPKLNWPDWVVEEKEGLRIKTGEYQLNESIVIPRNMKLTVEAGVNIDFTQGAFLWTKSAVQFDGNEASPIIFSSSDGSALGCSVLQADEKSSIKYTQFIGFNTFQQDTWTLTGAVTFYESDVAVANCLFENNHCEDALNIVRSEFDISDCKFEGIFADAFDADFCSGEIRNSEFNTVGNDAIDFSGSNIDINGLTMSNIADKGIIGGEASTLKVRNCEIIHSNIGVASKDRSLVHLDNVSVSKSEYGLVAYLKKKEYGAAEIKAKDCTISEVKTVHLIEKKSILYLDGNKIEGVEKNLQKLFY